MSVLLLRLAGPMQSWGESSRFRRRGTHRVPTKSGVLGLLAAAQGRRRTDPIEDLLTLRFGVRVDQPGTVVTDYHTAHDSGYSKPPTVSHRDYLSDAVFVAAVEGSDELIEVLHECVSQPVFPLFLGRRSCPVDASLDLGVHPGSAVSVLQTHRWTAHQWYARRQPRLVELSLHLDAEKVGTTSAQRDVPLSFDPAHRVYGWRNVEERSVTVENPLGRVDDAGLVDWFEGLGG